MINCKNVINFMRELNSRIFHSSYWEFANLVKNTLNLSDDYYSISKENCALTESEKTTLLGLYNIYYDSIHIFERL